MATSIPFVPLIAFCSIAFVVQGMIIVAGGSSDPVPCFTDDVEADPQCQSLGGNFFEDLGAIASFFVDAIVYLFRFVTFDLVDGMPNFIQVPLALVCGGGVLVVLVWLFAQVISAIGNLLPFT